MRTPPRGWVHRCGYRRPDGDFSSERQAVIASSLFQPELRQHFGRGPRIDSKPRANRCESGVINFIDQAGSKLDKLPLFLAVVRVGLNIQVGQDAQQGGPDIDALSARERHQPVEARK